MLQCFLEESRSLMRFPPRLSTAEADLKIPFQQVFDHIAYTQQLLILSYYLSAIYILGYEEHMSEGVLNVKLIM